ncbi:MAG: potassium-transporting ATPase subunit KdpA [Acidobacteria bacterium]|nr:potassium-transporting ATPase subunit KdpA [Acidobacteriota bacterium]
MSGQDFAQIGFYLLVLLAAVKPLGAYAARVYSDGNPPFDWVLGPVERIIYRAGGVTAKAEMTWKQYAFALLAFNGAGFLALYFSLRLQGLLPFNPRGFVGIEPHRAFNITASFVTNTNWQNYGGETTLSYFSQMVGLTVQNFVSAATGMAVLAALARGIARRGTEMIGNFWVDLTRTTLHILLPLSAMLTIALVSQGVVQNLSDYRPATTLEGGQELLPMGPAASQIAIKQLGTNGGGFFNVNSAHPLENPTPVSNLLQMLAILLIPTALCYTFGRMVGDVRQGWALLAAMALVFVPCVLVTVWLESGANPTLADLPIDQGLGNMEGKETRFGVVNSALWGVSTTAASNGSVNSMHDSFTPLGGLVPMFLMQLGEVVFGGVGSGLYGMLMFVIFSVFLAGLMVGRTPEYLGKKVEAFEVKMASIAVLTPPAVVLLGAAIATATPDGLSGVQEAGPHGLSEILYAFSSMGNNNGSAFAGYGANTPTTNMTGAIAMLAARYWVALPALAIAGSLAKKKLLPAGPGTLPTHSLLFIFFLSGVVVVVGALAFVPALALGPIAEHLVVAGN